MDAPSKTVSKSVGSVRGFLMKNRLSGFVFILSVLYSTVFIEYFATDKYFDFFNNEVLRTVLIVLTALVSMADPRLGIPVFIAVYRTFKYTRPENFKNALGKMMKSLKFNKQEGMASDIEVANAADDDSEGSLDIDKELDKLEEL